MEAISTGTFETDYFVKGKGAWLYTENGRQYFDGTSGSGAVSLGHQHPFIIEAVTKQLNKLIHTGCKLGSDIRSELIHDVGEVSPFISPTGLFTVIGSEAVEASLKVARAFTGKKSIIYFKYSYHGKTTASLSLTWRKEFKKYSNLSNQDFICCDLPASNASKNEIEENLQRIEECIKELIDNNNCPAAIILEPIRVTEGILPVDKSFLVSLVRLAHSVGILVIFDEIYTGLGRCGQMFYSADLEVKPDIILVGKTLGNGFPISLVIGEKEIINSLPSGIQTSTYSGNPVCCAAAKAVIEVIKKERLWEKAKVLELEFNGLLQNLSKKHSYIREIRTYGALFAFTCVDDFGKPSPQLAKSIKRKALENNLILFTGGFNDSIVKIVPPVLMSVDENNFLKETLSDMVNIN